MALEPLGVVSCLRNLLLQTLKDTSDMGLLPYLVY